MRTGITKAKRIAEAIREAGPYRWVGIYDVNVRSGTVSNIAWSGPNAPAYPVFPITKGITSRAISTRKTVNVGDVASDLSYLTALDSTRAIPTTSPALSTIVLSAIVRSLSPHVHMPLQIVEAYRNKRAQVFASPSDLLPYNGGFSISGR
jgi:hypothetical protein